MTLGLFSLGEQKGKVALCSLEHLCPFHADAQRNLFPDLNFSLDVAIQRSLETKTKYSILPVAYERYEANISPKQRESIVVMYAHISNLQRYHQPHYTFNCTAVWQCCNFTPS